MAVIIVGAGGGRSRAEPGPARRQRTGAWSCCWDVSASMNAMVEGQSNLDRAKAAAQGLIASLADSDTEVAVAEATGRLGCRTVRVCRAGNGPGRGPVEPFDGPGDLQRALEEAFDLWGDPADCEIYVFTDGPLPEPLGGTGRSWTAPPAGDNGAIVALSARRRRAKDSSRLHARQLWPHGSRAVRARFSPTAARGARFPPPRPARDRRLGSRRRLKSRPRPWWKFGLTAAADALATDNRAYITVPGLDDLGRADRVADGRQTQRVRGGGAGLAGRGGDDRPRGRTESGSPGLRCS